MADPLSVSSGVAGLISLAITVCQSLITYYKAWEGREDDVRSAVQDVEDVLKFLDLFNTRIGKLSVDQADIVNHAHTVKARIVEAVKKLEAIRDKCNIVQTQTGEQHRLRNFSRRFWYPFKKETLQELRGAVGLARAGLTDLLQLLQM